MSDLNKCCGAGRWRTAPECITMPKFYETRKTGPRQLAPAFYKECMPLVASADDPTVYEPISAPGQEIKAMTICGRDYTENTEPCYEGVVLQGCVNADVVCWPESFTDDDIALYEECSNCCIVFERPAIVCPPAPEDGCKTCVTEEEKAA